MLIVHPSTDRFRLPDMANGKLLGAGNSRHYSLDSPSLTSPPGYGLVDPTGHIIDQKPPITMSMMPSSCSAMSMSSSPQFHSFNPHLVMAPTAPPGLLHLSKFTMKHDEYMHTVCVVFAEIVILQHFKFAVHILQKMYYTSFTDSALMITDNHHTHSLYRSLCNDCSWQCNWSTWCAVSSWTTPTSNDARKT